ncbi:MAG: hypothetical protein GX024_06420, partial [Clostridiales bacterium]|nr:hypothetical protein [Clostridiales bacterium]
MGQQNTMKRISDKIKNIKNIEIYIAVLIIAIIVSLYTSSMEKPSSRAEEKGGTELQGVQW